MDNEMIDPWTQVKSYHGHFEISQTAYSKKDVKYVVKKKITSNKDHQLSWWSLYNIFI